MGLESKEEKILELFFNEGTRHWHFKDIAKNAKISDDRANYWLKKMAKEKIISHIKPKWKMPYFLANFESPEYKNKKKLFALTKLYGTGFLNHLQSLENVKTAVIFGSFARADWYFDSDIDLFILGRDNDIENGKYEKLLRRTIQLHVFKDKKELKGIRSGLLQNVVNGFFIKGSVQDLVEVIA